MIITAQRYKDYNKLRDKLPRSQNPTQGPPSRQKRMRPSNDASTTVQTPSKRQKTLPNSHPSVIDPYDPPISFLLSPSQQRAFIGPTPQKDGQVLGLFDGLSAHSKSGTPSKRQALQDRGSNVQATPSKKPVSREGSASGSAQKSATRAGMLDLKLTPSMQRIANSCTPGSRNSVRKLKFDDTPVFLRRDSQRGFTPKKSGAADDSTSWSPVAVRKPPKLAGRSLSAIVRGLRDMEDENLDEELELMREMEGGAPLTGPSKTKLKTPRILVEDSQQPDMPLGPDKGPVSEDDEMDYINEGKGKDGRPLRVWKKKGQKRTTRRVNMRPNTAKWKPEQKWKGAVSDNEGEVEEAHGDEGASASKPMATEVEEAGEDDDFEDMDGMDDSEDDETSTANRGKAPATKVTEGPPAKPKKKKISATAHANFRALKIRNKNSKGKGRGRFGRR